MSSTPADTTVFEVKITADRCMIQHEYAGSESTKAQYRISKGPKGWLLGCSHDQVLPEIRGYTKPKLDADACMAYDAGFFIWRLEAVADDEWVKV
jgi:hypothetical protein